MKKKKELIDKNNVFDADLSKVRYEIRYSLSNQWHNVFLQLEKQKQQVEAQLSERKMIDEKNCARCKAEIETAESLINSIKLRLGTRISRLNQLGEINLESKDEKELEQLIRDHLSCDFA